MSRKFKVPVGLVTLASNPASGSTGDSYFNTVSKQIFTYDGSNWVGSLTSQLIDGGTPEEVFVSNIPSYDGGTP